jgi:hypothetical protein
LVTRRCLQVKLPDIVGHERGQFHFEFAAGG